MTSKVRYGEIMHIDGITVSKRKISLALPFDLQLKTKAFVSQIIYSYSIGLGHNVNLHL